MEIAKKAKRKQVSTFLYETRFINIYADIKMPLYNDILIFDDLVFTFSI
jgi:hypothetical protein